MYHRQTMEAPVPEVIGAPSPQGVVVAAANNLPRNGIGAKRDEWYIPAHCPLFQTETPQNEPTTPDKYGVGYVTAHNTRVGVVGYLGKVVGISMDGVYDVENQRSNATTEGVTRLSMAVAGLVTLASTADNAAEFSYGDIVRVAPVNVAVERLQDTDFRGPLMYTNKEETDNDGDKLPSVGTFVSAIGPEGGFRCMLNFNL